ncbi:MAG: hypothetical protein R2737_02065 [Candidatus Nanopelagicales bacterium]
MTRYRLRLVCTDRGTHPSRQLGVLVGWRVGDGYAVSVEAHDLTEPRSVTSPQGPGEYADRATLGRTHRFTCPTCGRDLPMSQDRLVRLFTGTADAGVDRVDVSLLP